MWLMREVCDVLNPLFGSAVGILSMSSLLLLHRHPMKQGSWHPFEPRNVTVVLVGQSAVALFCSVL